MGSGVGNETVERAIGVVEAITIGVSVAVVLTVDVAAGIATVAVAVGVDVRERQDANIPATSKRADNVLAKLFTFLLSLVS